MTLFDDNWRFYRGDDSMSALTSYNDAGWRLIDLPHDYSIEDFPGTKSPFDSAAIGQVHTGFTIGGTAWYRKTFTIPANSNNKRIMLQFDGVYMNADFYINGVHLGAHPYGYTSFIVDLTKYINWNKKNTIAIRVKNQGRNSRWYSGSGIYRHVWLQIINNVHVAQWGSSITTPVIERNSANVYVKTTIQNESNKPATLRVITRIADAKGIIKATNHATQSIGPNESVNLAQNINIPMPLLWSVDAPNQYTAVTEIYTNKTLADKVSNSFGIRSISFDAEYGFRLNGKTLKLKGGCIHHDNGPLGAKAYDRAEDRKVALLKASGYNAVRTSHNPPSPAFLDACDKLGMLVIDEAFDTWNEKKNKEDYNLYFGDWWKKDLQNMILRDRNHPSVIMWSTGNEIPNRGKSEVAKVAEMLTQYVKTLDTTRPVTAGVNGIDQKPDAFTNAVDIPGYNYAEKSYVSDHERFPKRVMYGSESFPLDAFDYWMKVLDHPYVIGDFVWTAFDYIGEASIGWLGYPQSKNFYPWNLAFCGDLDICGWKRPQSFYRDALWKKDQLSLFVKPPVPTFKEWNKKLESWSRWNWDDVVPSWNWNGYEDSLMQVEVYSSCDSVELFLNGKSFGRKATGRNERFRSSFTVPYNEGTLNVVGYSLNKTVASTALQTTGEAVRIKLTPDRHQLKAGKQDLSYITIELVDEAGRKVFDETSVVTFTLSGPATIAGIANANPKNTASFQANSISTWQGRCMLIVKSGNQPGDIHVRAASPGFPVSILKLSVNK
ncbi:MAG: glycoside hydrolase family 2 TIM barrel-domain containing protein [Bacteroidota bacterium]